MKRIAGWAGIAMMVAGCSAQPVERVASTTADPAASASAPAAGRHQPSPPAARKLFGGAGAWTPYRSFSFEPNSVAIRGSHIDQVAEIAAYMEQNPTARLGLDGSVDGQFTDPRDRELNDRRAAAIRSALIQAGTPASRIETGAFGDPQLRRERQVEVLLIKPR